jgi:uncharacterized RDD family membrane protein YckC
MIFFACSSPRRSGCVRSAKQPVTKTCSQCGAVLPSGVRACHFCDLSLIPEPSLQESRAPHKRGRQALDAEFDRAESNISPEENTAWRGELAQKLAAYRVRRKKFVPHAAQSHLPFEEPMEEPPVRRAVATVTVAEPAPRAEDDFSFTIAIGRPSKKRIEESGRMEIDVSLPPTPGAASVEAPVPQRVTEQSGLYPVASIEDRRLAALVDAGCLFFAYGGFLALFSSLGGQFTLSKLSAAVYVSTFATVYLQYFALFTIFGGTTPGMMVRGLQVVSFSGEPPTPRQMLWRSAGYMLSAGTFFLGFLWSTWDEDSLTWHDRVSHTYLSAAQTYADLETSAALHGR